MYAVVKAGIRLLLTAFPLLLVSFTFAQTDPLPQFTEHPCPVDFAGDSVTCGVVSVPQDRSSPDERSVELAVAIFGARETPSLPDPVLFLDGGPGARTLDGFAGGLGPLLTRLNRTRDVIVFDYRGIGYSDPSMICSEAADAEAGWIAACRQRFAADGVDVTDYTTRDNAADAADIMAALGYTRYNIWGGSYGSSVALTLLRDRPQGVRAALITALQPPQADLQAESAANVLRTLDAVSSLCLADAACAQAMPADSLEQMLVQVIDRLEANPVSLEGYGLSGELDGLDVLVAVSEILKDEAMMPMLPGLISALYAESYDWLIPYANVLTDVTLPPNNYGAWLSMRCTDSILATSDDALSAVLADIPQSLASIFRGFHQQQVAMCHEWGARVPTSADRLPASTETPALIVSGALDPYSSQAWLDSALETLPNGRGYLVPYHMHYVQHQPCALNMMTGFIDDPTEEPDASCFEHIPAPIFRVQ